MYIIYTMKLIVKFNIKAYESAEFFLEKGSYIMEEV
jgi:hypothetical protein